MNIPIHKNCNGCGECCGPVPATISEIKLIAENITDEVIDFAKKNKKFLQCQFRDDKNKLCLIYENRPVICKLCGVTKGMECTNGNSFEIDGHKFIDRTEGVKMLTLKNVLFYKK